MIHHVGEVLAAGQEVAVEEVDVTSVARMAIWLVIAPLAVVVEAAEVVEAEVLVLDCF